MVTVDISGGAEHPRVCGENFPQGDLGMVDSGTSPRMRGKRGRFRAIFLGPGNIPAYAGKTFAKSGSSGATTEHPRVCGENGVYLCP